MAQVLDASSFGYLACALMIFSKSIWPAVLFHGLSDSPMQFEELQAYEHQVTSRPDWIFVVTSAALYISLGTAILLANNNFYFHKFKSLFRKLEFTI